MIDLRPAQTRNKVEYEKLNTSLAAALERHRQGCYEEVSTISKIRTEGPLAQTDATSSNVPSAIGNSYLTNTFVSDSSRISSKFV